MSSIQFPIISIDQATAVFQNVAQGIRSLEQNFYDTGSGVTAVNGKLDASSRQFEGFGRSVEMASGILLRDFVRSITRSIDELAELGGQLETLKISFTNLTAAQNVTALSLDKLRQATYKMVDDVTLLQAANQAMLLGLPTDEFAELTNAAIRLGHAQGYTAKQSIESLTMGIGRQSRLMLDNLGVMVNAERAYEWYAAQLGKVSSELTESEKRLGWQTYAIEETLTKAEQLGENIGKTAMQQEQWNAQIQNFKARIGETLGPLGIYIGQITNVLSPAIVLLIGQYAGLIVQKLANVAANIKLKVSTWALNTALATKLGLLTMGVGLIAAAAATTIYLAKMTAAATSSAEAFNAEMEKSIETLEDYTQAINALVEERRSGLETIDEYIGRLLEERERLQETLSQTDRYIQGVEATRQRIEQLDAQIQKLVESRQKLIDTTNKDINILKKERDALEETIDAIKESEKFTELISKLEHDFNLLQAEASRDLGIIATIFDDAFSTGRFKQAASIIKFFANQFGISFSDAERVIQDYLKTVEAVPDTIQESLYDKAQNILQRFTECSSDKLLDLEDAFTSAKERLRESIFTPGGQTRAQYEEWMRQLAELTASYDEAKAALKIVGGAELPAITTGVGRVGGGGEGAQLTAAAPSITIEELKIEVTGAIDKKTADYAVAEMKRTLRSLVFEATSSGTNVTTSRIREMRGIK